MITVGVRGVKLLQLLPDIPRWIYARWMILSGKGRVYPSDQVENSGWLIQHPSNGLTCTIGKPDIEVITEAIHLPDVPVCIVCNNENLNYIEKQLPEWKKSVAHLHVLSDRVSDMDQSEESVRFLNNEDLLNADHIPEDLRTELSDALLYTPVAAAFRDYKPVSFCYATAETETLWDISIDTLEPYRRRGLAAGTVRYMINYMGERGKRPVWGAEELNHASMNLARRLGFTTVDTLYLFDKE